MKRHLFLAFVIFCGFAGALAAEPFHGNVLESALLMRTKFNTPVILDPELLTPKSLARVVQLDTTSPESALRSFERALTAEGVTVKRLGSEYWVSSAELEADREKEIDLVLNATSYGALANQLQREPKPTQRTGELLQVAQLLASHERNFFSIQRDLTNRYIPKLRDLDFKTRGAVGGSTLSAPDPGKAEALVMERRQVASEIIQRASDTAAQFVSALNDTPTEIAALKNTVPDVVFNKILSDDLMILVRTYELFTKAAGSLGINVSPEEQESTKTVIERIRKIQRANSVRVNEYRALIAKAGLQSGVAGEDTLLALDASLKLFDDHNDRRQAVRRAIGAKIMTQLAAQVAEFRNPAVPVKIPTPETLFMLDAGDVQKLKDLAQSASSSPSGIAPYAMGNNGRVGAASILVVQSNRGKVGSISIELETKANLSKDPDISLTNLFGSASKQVSIHTSDSEAYLDSDFRASIMDALDLVQGTYDTKLFDSSISVAFDDTTGIAYGGDSAGLALGLATVSRIKNLPLDKHIVMTGSIRRYGDIRPIGGVYQKGTAALDDRSIALIFPEQNIENLFYLPVSKMLSTHMFTVDDFRQASGIAQIGDEKDNLMARRSIKLYNYALLAALKGLYGEAVSLSQAAAAASKNHFSAKLMSMLLRAAEIKPVNSAVVSRLLADAAVSTAGESTTAGEIASPAEQPLSTPAGASTSPMSALIAEFTAAGITGSDAINKLVEETRKATGKQINIVMQDLEQTKLGSTQINLSYKQVTFAEVLEQICAIGQAKFEEKNGLITISPAS